MVGVLKRMRRLNELLDLRFGPGAAVIADDVKRIHLRFAKRWNEGHFGSRKVWHNMLPRLKYYNPSVSITVERTDDQKGPATITVFFASTSSTTNKTIPQETPTLSTSGSKTPSQHEPWDRTHMIDAKGKTDSAILQELLTVTRGRSVEPNEKEKEQMAELEALDKQSEVDREKGQKRLAVQRREQEVLRQARASTELKD